MLISWNQNLRRDLALLLLLFGDLEQGGRDCECDEGGEKGGRWLDWIVWYLFVGQRWKLLLRYENIEVYVQVHVPHRVFQPSIPSHSRYSNKWLTDSAFASYGYYLSCTPWRRVIDDRTVTSSQARHDKRHRHTDKAAQQFDGRATTKKSWKIWQETIYR